MMKTSLTANDHTDLLARVYQLILSWPEPYKQETAASENFDGNTETAERATEPEGSTLCDSITDE